MTASEVRPTPTKPALRRAIKAQRAARTRQQREQLSRALSAVALEMPRIRAAECVTVYASLDEEPGTVELRRGLRDLRIRVLLPVVRPGGDTPELDWSEDAGDLVPSGPLALPEPTGPRFGPEEIRTAQVVIVPALAVDTTGVRLGRGGGFYDTVLLHVDPAASVLALVHDDELLDAETTPIPQEQHDVRVQGVVTPTRWMFFPV